MTYYQRLSKLKHEIFESARLHMTSEDYKHCFEEGYTFSERYSEKLEEIKDCGKDIYDEYMYWLKLSTGGMK